MKKESRGAGATAGRTVLSYNNQEDGVSEEHVRLE